MKDGNLTVVCTLYYYSVFAIVLKTVYIGTYGVSAVNTGGESVVIAYLIRRKKNVIFRLWSSSDNNISRRKGAKPRNMQGRV